MKIAYLINVYPMTSLSFVRREIQALEAQGIKVTRYSLRPREKDLPTAADREEATRTRTVLEASLAEFGSAVGALLLHRPAAFVRALATAVSIGRRSDRGLLRHLAYFLEACVLYRWLQADPVDHVHAHFATNPAAVALLCHEMGGPAFSFTVHGPHEFDMPAFIGLGEKIRRAAFTVAVSDYGRSQLYRWARFEDWPKLHVVRCGVPRDLLEAPPTRVPDVQRFVCVARFGEQKGHLLLIEAAARLQAEGLHFELLLVGDGPMRGEIERRIRENHLGGRVVLPGLMSGDEVRDAIVGSRAMVLPSFAEGLPVVIMESLALGRPVISTAIAGTPELVQPSVNGWLVPAGAVDPLAEAMKEVLRCSPEQLTRMGRAGAELVAHNHDALREGQRLAELFRDAIARSAARSTKRRQRV